MHVLFTIINQRIVQHIITQKYFCKHNDSISKQKYENNRLGKVAKGMGQVIADHQ